MREFLVYLRVYVEFGKIIAQIFVTQHTNLTDK